MLIISLIGSSLAHAVLLPSVAAFGMSTPIQPVEAASIGATETIQPAPAALPMAQLPTGSNVLTITKTISGTGTGPFPLTITGSNGYSTTTTINGGETKVMTGLAAGTYTVTESSPGAGWTTTYAATPGYSTGSSAVVTLTSVITTASVTPGAITGKVFRDFNSDGKITANGVITDTGVPTVTVTAYDRNGLAAGTATTNAAGNYTLNPTAAGPWRIEFTNLPTDYAPTSHGTNNGTSTQFVASVPATNINLGVNRPCEYCQDNPTLLFARYESGTGTGTNASNRALAAVNYEHTVAATKIAGFSEVGSVWGISYDRLNERAYSAAFLKRHVGLGPRGLDGVYVTDFRGASPTLLGGFDLQGVTASNGGTIDLGAVTRTGSDYALNTDPTKPTIDLDAFGKVARVGFGGMDMQENTDTLWLVNLNDRTLIALDTTQVTPSATNPNLAPGAAVQQYRILSAAGATGAPLMTGAPTCTNGQLRPFALKLWLDRGYLGAVCDASTSSTLKKSPDLMAYVLSFDPANPVSFTTEISFALDYTREPYYQMKTGTNLRAGTWQRWMNTWSNTDVEVNGTSTDGCCSTMRTAPQPLLSDIEILLDGSLVLSVMDRFAHQSGWANRKAVSGDSSTLNFGTAGDVLLAKRVGNGYVLESGQNDPGDSDPGYSSADSWGNAGEFFYGDAYKGSDASHHETTLGGVTAWSGSAEIVATAFDPNQFNSQGLKWLSTSSGKSVDALATTTSTNLQTFGKAGGMGDVELLCDPAPIEIGNRVWNDINNNGRQDPGEAGINGIQVSLQSPTGTVGTVTTSGDGNYYFGGLQPNTAYTLTIPTAPANYSLTTANAVAVGGASVTGNDAISDTIDSDATLVGSVATIYYTTGDAGANNHGLDFGYAAPVHGQVDIVNIAPLLSLGNQLWYDTNNNGILDGGEQGVVDGILVELYQDSDGNGSFSPGDTWVANTATSGGYYGFTNLAASISDATRYLVVISDTNFLPGGLLTGYINSDGQFVDPADAAGDSQDHGAPVNRLGQPGGVVASTAISLTAGTQPTGEGNEASDPIQAANDINSNQTIDFGFYQLRLGNRIWDDLNNNGIDDDEPALSSALIVTATNETTSDVYTTTTDARGYYTFTGIISGTYVVSFVAPPGYVSSGTDGGANGADLDDNGLGGGGGLISSAPFALTPGATITDVQTVTNATGTTTNPSVDFGVWLPAALGNYVWLDTTIRDGLQTEPIINGVNGVTVTLFYSNAVDGVWEQLAVLQTANHPTTNEPGYYTFTNLISGTYYLSFTAPSGYTFTTQSGAVAAIDNSDANPASGITAPITLQAGEQNLHVDAGLLPLTMNLGNQVWYDMNNDGQLNSTESGLDNVRVELYRDSNGNGLFDPGIDSFVTYSNTVNGGYYTFTNLAPTTDVNSAYLVVITSTNFSTILQGYQSSDSTDLDANNNEDNDDNGAPVAGGAVASRAISLTVGTEPNTLIFGGDSNWSLDFGFSLRDFGDAPASYSTTLSNTTAYLGASHVLSSTLFLGSRVDAERDGQPVTVGAAATGDDNTFAPAGFGGTGDDEDGILFVSALVPGQVATIAITVTGNGGYLNGWLDFDGDGTWTQADNQIFAGLAVANGTTTLTFTVPLTASTDITTYARFRLSTDPALNFYDVTTSAPDGEVEDYDLQILPLVLIGNRLWIEDDNDGTATTGVIRPVGAGHIVTATASNGTTYTGVTNASGLYTITVPPNATYTVTTDLPGGGVIDTPILVTDGSDPLANNDLNHARTGTTVVVTVTNNLSIDFGFFLPPLNVGNFVWFDSNANGSQDPSEPGIAGAIVALFLADGSTPATDLTANVVATQTTASDGFYNFGNLSAGAYLVQVTMPSGYMPTINQVADPENDDDTDSNIASSVNNIHRSGVITLTVGGEPASAIDTDDTQGNLTVDFGFVPLGSIGDTIWFDLDNSGGDQTTQGSEAGLADIVVRLTNDQGTILTTTTTITGFYLFTNLPIGTYTVTVVTSTLPSTVLPTPSYDADGNADSQSIVSLTPMTPDDRDQDFSYPPASATATPTSTPTGTLLPPTATSTPTATPTNTLVPPTTTATSTATATDASIPPTATSTPTATNTPVPPTATLTSTATDTPVPSPATATSTSTATGTLVPPTATATNTLTATSVPSTATATSTSTATDTSVLPTATATSTATGTLVPPTPTNTVTATSVPPTATSTATGTLVPPTATATSSVTVTSTPVPPTMTSTNTAAATSVPPTVTPTSTPTATLISTATATGTLVPVAATATSTATATGTSVPPTQTSTPTHTATSTPVPLTQTSTPTAIPTNTASATPANTATATATPVPPTATPTNTATSTNMPVPPTATLTNTPTATNIPVSPTPTSTPTVTATHTLLPPTVTLTGTATPTTTPVPPTATSTPTATTTNTPVPPTATDLPVPPTVVPTQAVVLVNLGNQVWHDRNDNGLIDNGEEGIRDVALYLFREGDDPLTATPLLMTTTDSNGYYLFANLPPARYFVYIPQPLPRFPLSSTPSDGADNGEDHDDNGDQPGGAGTPVRSPVIDLVAGSEPDYDGDGTNGDLTVDFGFYTPASLGDLVWFDLDRDGVQDATETGLSGQPIEVGVPGVLVTLYDAITNTPLATTVTDTAGHYRFNNLRPGTYTVGFVLPSGYELTMSGSPATMDAFDSDVISTTLLTPAITLASGEHKPMLDMGLYLAGDLLPAGIGNYVWYDGNQNGVQDNGESGVPGVSVTLYAANGTPIATTTTGNNGQYLFGVLPPGDYYLGFTPPADYLFSPPNATADDQVDSDVDPTTHQTPLTTLVPGEWDMTWDLDLYLGSPSAALGDYVWIDSNVNGQQDANEPGVSGVSVTLYHANGTAAATLTTDATGHYLFNNLPAGDYYLYFAPPTGYLGIIPDQGGDNALDSDVDPATGYTPLLTLPAGTTDLSWDYGLWIPNETSSNIEVPATLGNWVWYDTNINGLQDPGELPAANIVVQLYNSAGELLAIDVTDETGTYLFTGLLPGDYYVEFLIPDTYAVTISGTTPGNNLDSNVDAQTGRTPIITLLTGMADLTWDAGIYQLPTSLAEGDEPISAHLYLPLVARRNFKPGTQSRQNLSFCHQGVCIAP